VNFQSEDENVLWLPNTSLARMFPLTPISDKRSMVSESVNFNNSLCQCLKSRVAIAIVHRKVAEDAKRMNIFLSAERAERKNSRFKAHVVLR